MIFESPISYFIIINLKPKWVEAASLPALPVGDGSGRFRSGHKIQSNPAFIPSARLLWSFLASETSGKCATACSGSIAVAGQAARWAMTHGRAQAPSFRARKRTCHNSYFDSLVSREKRVAGLRPGTGCAATRLALRGVGISLGTM